MTTSNLNLRADASTVADIILVMPEGATVMAGLHPDSHIDGFVGVYYQGNFGYAYEEFLSYGGGGDDERYPIVGIATVNDSVNFREGPGTSYAVQAVLEVGTLVDISGEVADGFRCVQYSGMDGWIYDEFLTEGNYGGYANSTMVTTSNLNLRDGATLDGEVLTVIPYGAEVYASDCVVNGFRSVEYGGYIGWAYEDYLQ